MDILETRATDNTSTFRFYYYSPSVAAAALFIALFALTTSAHIFQMFRSKVWFMIPFIIGGLFEITGYSARLASALQNPGPYSLGPFIIQSVLILVAPALFAASLYMELGRIVQMIGADSALFIRRTWLTKIFVCGDVTSFLIQAGGAGLLASPTVSMQKYGKYIVTAGLVLQIIFFGLFVLAAAIFQSRVMKTPTTLSTQRPWVKHMVGLYLVSVMIFTRSIVRTAEYVQGYQGFIYDHEGFLYGFDAAVMFAAMVVMSVVHPGEVARFVRMDGERKDGEKGRGDI